MNSLLSGPIWRDHLVNNASSQAAVIPMACSDISLMLSKLSTNIATQQWRPLFCSALEWHTASLKAATSTNGSLPAAPAERQPVKCPTYLCLKIALHDPTLRTMVGRECMRRNVEQRSAAKGKWYSQACFRGFPHKRNTSPNTHTHTHVTTRL